MAAYFSPSTCIKRNRIEFKRKMKNSKKKHTTHTQHTKPLFFPTRCRSPIDIQLPEKTAAPVIRKCNYKKQHLIYPRNGMECNYCCSCLVPYEWSFLGFLSSDCSLLVHNIIIPKIFPIIKYRCWNGCRSLRIPTSLLILHSLLQQSLLESNKKTIKFFNSGSLTLTKMNAPL